MFKCIFDEKYDYLQLHGVYVCMYWMNNVRLQVRIFFIGGSSKTHDAHFTELSFESPRVPVIL